MTAMTEKTVSQKETAIELLKRIEAADRQSSAQAARANRAEAKLAALTDENAMLRAQLAAQTTGITAPVAVDGFYSWGEFFSAVFASLNGKTNRWQTDFAEQTGVNLSTIQKWRLTGKVPAINYEMALVLKTTVSASQTRQAWSGDEYDALQILLDTDPRPTYATIASTLTKDFGRKITENAIKGSVDRLKKGR